MIECTIFEDFCELQSNVALWEGCWHTLFECRWMLNLCCKSFLDIYCKKKNNLQLLMLLMWEVTGAINTQVPK